MGIFLMDFFAAKQEKACVGERKGWYARISTCARLAFRFTGAGYSHLSL